MIEPSAIRISLKTSNRLFLFSRETKSEQTGLAWARANRDARFETEAEEFDSVATTTSARNKKKVAAAREQRKIEIGSWKTLRSQRGKMRLIRWERERRKERINMIDRSNTSHRFRAVKANESTK